MPEAKIIINFGEDAGYVAKAIDLSAFGYEDGIRVSSKGNELRAEIAAESCKVLLSRMHGMMKQIRVAGSAGSAAGKAHQRRSAQGLNK